MDVIRHGNVYMTITDLERKLPLYLMCVGGWRNQYRIERKEGYPDYQWIQCTSGQGILEIGGTEYTVGAGQGMLLYPDEPHQYFARIEPWEVRWAAFNGTSAETLLRSLELSGSRVITLASPDPVLKLLYDLISAAESTDPLKSLHCSSILYNIVLGLYRYGFDLDLRSKQHYFDQMAPALRFIESNSHKPITLDEVAGKMSVTPQYACVLFQLALGMRPFEYITGVRLRKAKEALLREPQLSVAEAGRRAGYESPSYFIKIFKRNEGMTPREFRKQFLNAT
ncbi:AraC family transcriptional regulator [Paenibacillus sp. GYB003]|uniref:AraC family transcriptional regulator n=1 Tax=Paenibacillus sp. GYB003 TaxID=2994392 RepID=UPI002F964FE9